MGMGHDLRVGFSPVTYVSPAASLFRSLLHILPPDQFHRCSGSNRHTLSCLSDSSLHTFRGLAKPDFQCHDHHNRLDEHFCYRHFTPPLCLHWQRTSLFLANRLPLCFRIFNNGNIQNSFLQHIRSGKISGNRILNGKEEDTRISGFDFILQNTLWDFNIQNETFYFCKYARKSPA